MGLSRVQLAEIEQRIDERIKAGKQRTPPPWKVGTELGGKLSEVIAPCECCGRIAVCDQFGASDDNPNCFNSTFIAFSSNDWDDGIADMRRLVATIKEKNGW